MVRNQECLEHESPDSNCHKCLGRPNRRSGRRGEVKHKQDEKTKLSGQAATLARKVFRNEVVDAMDGPLALVSDPSSEEDDVPDASAAPIPPEADFMYSYDSQSGPRAGGDILSYAITQAVRRFENNETEKLVHREYDVVNEKEMAEISTDENEADFEMIEHAHLN